MADDLGAIDTDVRFPAQMYSDPAAFARDYYDRLAAAAKQVDMKVIGELADDLDAAIKADKGIFICGNGGSAAVANHTLCDMIKCVSSDTKLTPRMHSLSVNTELLSALANDIGYDQVFSYQLDMFARPGDMLITVSSSGNSPNVLNAIEKAKEIGMKSYAFTGFSGGESSRTADRNLHVPGHNYGIAEDIHMSAIHIVAQFIRMKNLNAGVDYKTLKF